MNETVCYNIWFGLYSETMTLMQLSIVSDKYFNVYLSPSDIYMDRIRYLKLASMKVPNFCISSIVIFVPCINFNIFKYIWIVVLHMYFSDSINGNSKIVFSILE